MICIVTVGCSSRELDSHSGKFKSSYCNLKPGQFFTPHCASLEMLEMCKQNIFLCILCSMVEFFPGVDSVLECTDMPGVEV